ncbi:MAG: PDZ domain-containing protein, partial [Nitrososphaeraceae archaeon]
LNIDNFTRGEIVTGITPGSPAERAGIDAMNLTEIPNSGAVIYTDLGDIILTVDGSTSFATDFDNLEEYAYDNKRAGENVTLTILRDGQISDIEFYTGSLPEFQWYENTDKGLKLKYPTSWLVSDDDSHMTEGRVVEFSPAENNGSKSAPAKPTVTVTVYPPSAADGTINSDGNNDNTNISLLNSNTTTLANTHAYRTVFNDYSTDYPIKVLTVFAIKDMHLYRIDYSALVPIYEDYLDPAIEMIESFQFIK